MQKIIIYGAGGFGRETAVLIHQINLLSRQWELIGYCDDGKAVGERIGNLTVLGGKDYLRASNESIAVVIAIADPSVRKRIREQLVNSRITFPALVHPNVSVNENCTVAEGCIVCAGVIMTTSVHLQSFSIVNLACTLGHDVEVGPFSSLMPAVNVSGNVRIGPGVYVGVGAILLQGISVGDGSVIGAGAVVTKSFESNKTIMGVPARSI